MILSLFINNALSEEVIYADQSTISPEVQAENEKKSIELENFLFGNDGIISQVNDELKGKGYLFQTLVAAYSVDEIHVIFVLSNREATVSEQEIVKTTFFEIVEKNKLDPAVFALKVADSDDEPDW